MDDLLEKCSAAHYLLSQCARRGLRAKRRFWEFARKFQLSFLFTDKPGFFQKEKDDPGLFPTFLQSSTSKKPAEANACYGKKGYVIGEITALEVAVITYIKRGEG